MDIEAETQAGGLAGPLQHLQVTVGVAESRDRPTADDPLDGERLALLVVDEVNGSQLDEHRLAIAHFELLLPRAADDLLGRNGVDLLGERAHELHATARNNK